MPRIDIGAVLADKAPRLARWIPASSSAGSAARFTSRRSITFSNTTGTCPAGVYPRLLQEWQVTYTVEGLEKLDPKGRYLFAANHPFWGMDGMMLADKLIDRFGDARGGGQRPADAPRTAASAMDSGEQARFAEQRLRPQIRRGVRRRRADPDLSGGLLLALHRGEVTDLPWKTNFLKRPTLRGEIVPVFVEGRLSNFFYRVARLRVMLGLKLNIEMLWLPDEMFSQKGRHFRIFVGDPIPVSELQRYGGLREQAEFVRKRRIFGKYARAGTENAKIGILPPVICNRDKWKPSYLPSKGTAPRRTDAGAQGPRYEEGRERDLYLLGRRVSVADARDRPPARNRVPRRGVAASGKELDIDAEDLAEDGYYQLIVWDPAAEEIVGGYRFIICTDEYPRHLSTEHYFRFSDKFRRKYLPPHHRTGPFVCAAPPIRPRGNAKSIYALDNLWDGLGALIVLDPAPNTFSAW